MSYYPEYHTHMENLRVMVEFLQNPLLDTDIKNILDSYGFGDLEMEKLLQDRPLQARLIQTIEQTILHSQTSWEDEWIQNKHFILKSIVDDDMSLHLHLLLSLHPRIVKALERESHHYLQTGNIDHFLTEFRRSTYTRRYQEFVYDAEHIVNGAAAAGHLDVVKKILPSLRPGALPPKTALTAAARLGHLDVVQFLMAHVDTKFYENVLSSAAEGGHLEVVQHLIPHVRHFYVALASAARMGHRELVDLLLPLTDKADLALVDAASRGHVEIVELLIPHASQRHGLALECAVSDGHMEVVQMLIPYVKTFNAAMVRAVTWQYIDIVKILLPHIQNIDEAMVCALGNGYIEIVDLLFPYITDPDKILKSAAKGGYYQLVGALIPRCRDFGPALGNAAEAGHHRAFELLLPCVSNPENYIQPAILGGNLDVVGLVLPHVDKNKIDEIYCFAMEKSRWHVAQLLAPHVQNADKAAARAIHAGQTQIVKMLLPRLSKIHLLIKLAEGVKSPTMVQLLSSAANSTK